MEYLIRTPQQLGAVLRGRRREKQLTQAIAGSKVGLRQNAVSVIEAQPGRSTVMRLFKLLSALDLELSVRDKRKSKAPGQEW
jgi:HTH-type transcriptional regulator / antitoxin HipB